MLNENYLINPFMEWFLRDKEGIISALLLSDQYFYTYRLVLCIANIKWFELLSYLALGNNEFMSNAFVPDENNQPIHLIGGKK